MLTSSNTCAIITNVRKRVCWNWQTGTFEGRVSMTYGFKSRHSHHVEAKRTLLRLFLFKKAIRPLPCFSSFVKGHVQVGYSLASALITPLFHYQPFTRTCLRHTSFDTLWTSAPNTELPVRVALCFFVGTWTLRGFFIFWAYHAYYRLRTSAFFIGLPALKQLLVTYEWASL